MFISGIPSHVTVEQIGEMFGSIGIIKVKKLFNAGGLCITKV